MHEEFTIYVAFALNTIDFLPFQERNTFQTNLISGTNILGDDITFVEYLYKQLDWTDNAQVMYYILLLRTVFSVLRHVFIWMCQSMHVRSVVIRIRYRLQ